MAVSPVFGGDGADGVDDDVVAGQRAAPPGQADLAEQPVLDLVPLAGAGREVADGDLQPGLLRQDGEPGLPGPVPVAVGTAGVAGDQQPGGAGVGVLPGQVPPAADRLHRQRGGVPVGADVHEPGVRLPRRRCRTGSRARRPCPGSHGSAPAPGSPAGRPFPAVLPVVPDLLLLLGVHADHRLPGSQVLFGLRGDVPELGVPLRVLPPLGRLGVGLHGCTRRARITRSTVDRAARVPLRRQLARPGAPRSASSTPAATADLPASQSRDQRLQRAGSSPGSVSASRLRPAARTADPARPAGLPPTPAPPLPSATVCDDAPVSAATAAVPPSPGSPRPPSPAPAASTAHPASAAAARSRQVAFGVAGAADRGGEGWGEGGLGSCPDSGGISDG